MSAPIPTPPRDEGSLEALRERMDAMEKQIGELKLCASKQCDPNKLSLVVFSGELDKLLAAFIVANGAASMGMEVHLFFTFWGTAALRKKRPGANRPILDWMFGQMLPMPSQLKLSRMNMGGLGAAMIRKVMKSKNVSSLEELMEMAKEQGIRIGVCDMSMDLLGIRMEELIDYPEMERCGVGAFLGEATDSCQTLFI